MCVCGSVTHLDRWEHLNIDGCNHVLCKCMWDASACKADRAKVKAFLEHYAAKAANEAAAIKAHAQVIKDGECGPNPVKNNNCGICVKYKTQVAYACNRCSGEFGGTCHGSVTPSIKAACMARCDTPSTFAAPYPGATRAKQEGEPYSTYNKVCGDPRPLMKLNNETIDESAFKREPIAAVPGVQAKCKEGEVSCRDVPGKCNPLSCGHWSDVTGEFTETTPGTPGTPAIGAIDCSKKVPTLGDDATSSAAVVVPSLALVVVVLAVVADHVVMVL